MSGLGNGMSRIPARTRVVRRNPNMSPHEIQQRQEAAEARQARAERGYRVWNLSR